MLSLICNTFAHSDSVTIPPRLHKHQGLLCSLSDGLCIGLHLHYALWDLSSRLRAAHDNLKYLRISNINLRTDIANNNFTYIIFFPGVANIHCSSNALYLSLNYSLLASNI